MKADLPWEAIVSERFRRERPLSGVVVAISVVTAGVTTAAPLTAELDPAAATVSWVSSESSVSPSESSSSLSSSSFVDSLER